jgi:hypothetical protein
MCSGGEYCYADGSTVKRIGMNNILVIYLLLPRTDFCHRIRSLIAAGCVISKIV